MNLNMIVFVEACAVSGLLRAAAALGSLEDHVSDCSTTPRASRESGIAAGERFNSWQA
jgi:hypothetical protein